MSKEVVLITGASRGIGRGIALALGRSGRQVVVNYRGNVAAATSCVQEIEAAGGVAALIQADISKAADRERLVATTLDEFGRLDVLVNNAGMAPRTRFDLLETTESSYDEVMNVNLKGPFFLTQRVAQWMIEQTAEQIVTSPCIINIGSISAYTASTNRGEYCISKAGIGMMTALFAARLAEHGIKVYEVRPGVIATDMTDGVRDKYDQLIRDGLTPIRRWGEADDVARAVMALVEGALPFSTGEVINVDGGYHMRRL